VNTNKILSSNNLNNIGLPNPIYSKAKNIAMKVGLCPKTIYRWADKGAIKRYKVSERICLYDEQEIIDYIDANLVVLGKEVNS
jgi:predicted site-specific integrase-resolvase